MPSLPLGCRMHPLHTSMPCGSITAVTDKGHQLDTDTEAEAASSGAHILVAPSLSCDSRADRRGSYKRTEGKGLRRSWATCATEHLEALRYPAGDFYSTCFCNERPKLHGCPKKGLTCAEHIRARDLLDCLITTYGDPLLDAARNITAKGWPSLHNHSAGNRWFDAIKSCFSENEFRFVIASTSVCASFWRAAHDIPRATFDHI